MGSILIRHVPNAVHKKFKANCRQRNISMEQAIVQLIEGEVIAARRGRKTKAAPRRKAARTAVSRPRGAAASRTPRRGRTAARPKRTVRRPRRVAKR